ncbi:MAG: hypothetical protein ACKVU0_04015 [Saprospiraceae bacterium]
MKKTRLLGIWMDNASAHTMTYVNDSIITEVIHSAFTNQEREESSNKSENLMHNKEQQQQGSYYKRLGDIIKNYQKVLIFGPTNAKSELANVLKVDHHFDEIEIEVKSADKMTEPQMHAFVKDYFNPET